MSLDQLTPPRSRERAPDPGLAASSPISILVGVGGAEDDEAAVAVAADLAFRHRSPITVVNTFDPQITVLPGGFAGGGVAAMQVGEALNAERADVAERIQGLLDDYARRYGFTPEGLREDGYLRMARPAFSCWATLMRELPLIDLAVLAQSSVRGDGAWIGPLGEGLMASRTPVYVARDGKSTAGRPAAIAWDGGFEAARAVRAALPLLKDAGAVAIVQASDKLKASEAERADPGKLKAWLLAHGVTVQAVEVFRTDNIGEGLLAAARGFDAALLVAGAYHHSRIREALFGGTTRAFLEAREGPHLLVAH
jgi:nucleotide-binding universal stress UspA family protein